MSCPSPKCSNSIVGNVSLYMYSAKMIDNSHHPIFGTYKVFLLTANTAKSNTARSILKKVNTGCTMSSMRARKFCGFSSQRSQLGRQVKFLWKKSSLHVRLVSIKAGRTSESLVADDSVKSGSNSELLMAENSIEK